MTHKFGAWISVKDTLPENNDWVLGKNDDGILTCLIWHNHLYKHWVSTRSGIKVTHWMPMPDINQGPLFTLAEVERFGRECFTEGIKRGSFDTASNFDVIWNDEEPYESYEHYLQENPIP
jgi:hypothetical protein